MRGKKHRNTQNVSMVSRTWVSDIVARLTWNDAEKADCAGSKMQPEDWKDHCVTLRPRCNVQHHHNVGAASPSVSQKGDPDTRSPPRWFAPFHAEQRYLQARSKQNKRQTKISTVCGKSRRQGSDFAPPGCNCIFLPAKKSPTLSGRQETQVGCDCADPDHLLRLARIILIRKLSAYYPKFNRFAFKTLQAAENWLESVLVCRCSLP